MRLFTKNTAQQTALSSETNLRVYDFLKSQLTGVLSLVDPNGNPHATVIYFSVDNYFNCYFITKHDTKKFDSIVHQNHGMLVVFDAQSQTTAQIKGVIEDISDSPIARHVFNTMKTTAEGKSDSGVAPISKLFAGEYVCFKLRPRQIRMAVFARPDPGGYDMYETIDFD